jgi:hypothetical protein
MGKNRIFLPQEALDRWLDQGSVEVRGDELRIFPEHRRYRLVEAVRVVSEVTGAADPFGIVGSVKTVAFLLELGAELLGDSMIVGDAAFQVVPGWLGMPLGAFSDYLLELGSAPARGQSDEELLAHFLARNS